MGKLRGMERYRYTTSQYPRYIGPGVPRAPYHPDHGNTIWGYVVYAMKLHGSEIAIVDRTPDRKGWVCCTLAEPITCRAADIPDDAVDLALADMQKARGE